MKIEYYVKPAVLFVLLSLLLAGCGAAQGPAMPRTPIAVAPPVRAAAAPTATPMPAEALDRLATEEQIAVVELPNRDRRLLTLELDPELDDIPVVVNATPPSRAIGDLETFWVHDTSTERNVQITARLVYSTPVVYAWVEDGEEYDHDALAQSIDRFSGLIYPRVVNTFGSEWNPGVDNDPRLHILHTAQTGPSVAGYFYSADEYSRLANPFSNEKEMFYINLDILQWGGGWLQYETILAHEFQHMIHWNIDRGEETWLGEGLSEFAQEVAGYDADTGFARSFAVNPDLQLNAWSPETGTNAPHYGAAYLFVAYLAQRFGQDFLTTLIGEPANGFYGIDAAFAAAGLDAKADDVFADWVVANWAQDPNALGEPDRYGYRNFTLALTPAAVYDTYPVQADGAVSNYATDYVVLEGEGDLRFDFAGATQTNLAEAPIEPGSVAWWSNRGDDSNPRLSRTLDLSTLAPGTPVTLTVEMWYDIEENYDYGYVMASRDGEKWQTLPAQHTSAGDPTGNNLGVGYTGRSGEWLTEQFDLTAYAGAPVQLQFSYVTDDAVNTVGWLVRAANLTDASGASTPIDMARDWLSAGWLRTDNVLPQHWLVQVMEFDDGTLRAVRRVPVDQDGQATFEIAGLGEERTAVVAISGLTRGTTLPAAYSFTVEPQ